MSTVTLLDGVDAAEAHAAASAGVAIDNAGLAVLQTIRAYGVDTVFGIPGTHNLEFYRHLGRLGMHAVTSRHEQGAGYAADGWAQRTGMPGVVVTTSGPGLLNALSAAGTAYCESRPLIILSPGVPLGAEFADIGTLHETKDAFAASGAIVEWSRRVTTAAEAVAAVHDAFDLFRTERPRPVHIEIPLDVLESAADVPAADREARPHPGFSPADADAVARAAALLAGAEKPAIIVGGGSTRAAASLTALAERLGAPVVSTLNGKGVVPESHPLAVGAELRLDAAREVVNGSDVLLIVGAKIGEAELWGGVVRPAGRVVRVDVLASQGNKNVLSDVVLVGHAEAVVMQLRDAVGPGTGEVWTDLDAVRAACAAEASAFHPETDRAARAIAAALPADAVVAGDSSQITYLGMASAVRQDEPHAFLYTPAYATLGYGLPAAIGAAVAERARGEHAQPVVCVVGDGALMFAVQEFATAVEQSVDITVVCYDNGGYAEIQQNEADRGIPPVGVRLAQPDWAALADAFGGRGRRVEAAADLDGVIRDALDAGGVNLVHVPARLFA
ncbi:thiamine pyrophosphate-binding protein [Microbacterium mangrovi]|uniref:thiamine pyrophosphate-binding protein n=1 Tax=Microbacterium mangrovi TaxID=1348253 RepID=UPI000691F786|nr:thiamine pyrophosphate-binding protein [Microbacterium mangrovi]